MEGLIGGEKNCISARIRHVVQAEVPRLARCAEYFFQPGVEGKRVRSSALLLMASALSPGGTADDPLEREKMLVPDLRPYNHYPEEVRRKQQRIAEITEMIHVATLLHDDVLDDAETRRGIHSVNKMFGNKAAILAGDFLLAKASVALASLRNTEVLTLMATVIENLVTGEMMQLSSSFSSAIGLGTTGTGSSEEDYFQKSFLKTASLFQNSCKSVALLGGADAEVAELAGEYGRHLGLAFQIRDDVLDLSDDIAGGIPTLPVLLEPNDLDLGVAKTMEIANRHSQLAMKAVDSFPAAESKHAQVCRDALKFLAHDLVKRKA